MAGQKSEARGFLEESFIVTCHKTTRADYFPGKKVAKHHELQKRTNREKRIFSKIEDLRHARNTARGHKRARDKVRARARARARAFGRLTNCFGRGLTSSTREQPTAFAVLYSF